MINDNIAIATRQRPTSVEKEVLCILEVIINNTTNKYVEVKLFPVFSSRMARRNIAMPF